MFAPTPQPNHALEAIYFRDWLDGQIVLPDFQNQAERLFANLVVVASPLRRLQVTPQTPPYHSEAPMVSGHVLRILCGLLAFERGASLAQVEEFARAKDYLLEFQALEQTLCEQSAFLTAFAACHDLAKADTLAFEAPAGSKGAAEGFQLPGRELRMASEPERVRYDKLRRAHEAKGGSHLSFFAEYQIQAHYLDHARKGAADEYASTREAVLKTLRVPLSSAKLMTELIRMHMDVIHGFDQGPDPLKYKALAAIAERVGLNLPVFLDLLPATLFLDAILGSQIYHGGVSTTDTHLLMNLFRSEREAMPERHAAREEALRRGRKHAIREILEEAKIDAETVFALLKTPFGPVRGQVMAKIYDLIRDPDRKADFGEYTAELRKRARLAQGRLKHQHLSVDYL